MPEKKLDLSAAYSLKSTQDSIDLYGQWAATYDTNFAQAYDYQNPRQIADIFASHTLDNTPILDVGAGTGLVGVSLAAHGLSAVDALDISPEMLEISAAKGCYRAMIHADLSAPIAIADDTYRGITSAGTFTHGHVGPHAIDELLRIAKSGALFVLGINGAIYKPAGFAAKFASLKDRIADFQIIETKGYGPKASAELQKSRSAVAVFHKR